MRRTRLTNLLAILTLSLALAAPFLTQQIAAAQNAASRLSVGEKLTYTVSFSNFPTAAHVEIYVAGRGSYFNREGVELRAHVATVDQVRAALLALDNYYFTYVDPQSGLPYRAQTSAADTPPPPATSDGLDPATQIVDITTLPAPTSAEATPSVHDLLSAIYSLRSLPLAPGSIYPFTTQLAGTQYDAELRVTGRETVNTPAGSFNALATQVRVRANHEADDYRVQIFFSDDARHVPVFITAHHRAGEIRIALASDEVVLPPTPSGQLAAPTPNATPVPPPITNDPARTGIPPRIAAPPAPGASGANASGSKSDLPFDVGEQLNYNFYLGNATQPIGTASFLVRTRARFFNREGFQLIASMASGEALQNAFPVRDSVISYISTTTLLPFRNELQIQEGKHHTQGVVSFDQERGAAIVTDNKTVEIPVGTYDFVSVLYALRSFDLTPPRRNAVSLLINKRPRTLFIASISRDMIEVGGQRISAYQLALATDEAQGDRFKLHLWVGTDKRRLPLRLTAVTPLGLVHADLSIIPLTRQ